MTVEPDRKGESISSLGAKVGDCLSVMPETGLGRNFPVVRIDSFVAVRVPGVQRPLDVWTATGVTAGPQGPAEVSVFVIANANLFGGIVSPDLVPRERLLPNRSYLSSGAPRGIV